MKIVFFLSLSLVFFFRINAQTPKLYINLGTHNEMLNESWDTNEQEYERARDSLLLILNKINTIGGKWNFQTCSKFVLGALNWENAASSSTDLFDLMEASGNVEIDSRNKRELPVYNYNISDVYHLLDSCGVTSTHTVGGFLHYPFNNEDWTDMRNSVLGNVYHEPWQAEIIWGGGSPNHSNDANDYGVWKPKDGDTETNFYTHAPDSNLWFVGNGCAPVISDTTTSVQWIINLINKQVQDIENGLWPANKFYNLTVMINCRDLDEPHFVQKVDSVLDVIDFHVINGDIVEWATITQKLNLFQSWSQQYSIAYSQWDCETANDPALAIQEMTDNQLKIFPNPATDKVTIVDTPIGETVSVLNVSGQTFKEIIVENHETMLDLSNFPPGIYLVKSGIRYAKLEVVK